MNYELHDLTYFPYVELISAKCTSGFAKAWGQEMNALLAADTPFVVAFEPSAIAEEPEDYRTRAQWFKANRKILKDRCAAMVAVVRSAIDRDALAEDLHKRSRGFGVIYVAMASFEEARMETPRLLSEAVRANAD